MDIKELRIGDLIYCKTDKGTKVGRIDSLQEISKYAFFVTVKTTDGVDYRGKVNDEYNCIEPIPITEEILLKIGFKKGQGNGYASYKINPYDGHIIEVALYESGIDAFIQYICGACHLRTIKHLHELQNIVFAITGKELEVEL